MKGSFWRLHTTIIPVGWDQVPTWCSGPSQLTAEQQEAPGAPPWCWPARSGWTVRCIFTLRAICPPAPSSVIQHKNFNISITGKPFGRAPVLSVFSPTRGALQSPCWLLRPLPSNLWILKQLPNYIRSISESRQTLISLTDFSLLFEKQGDIYLSSSRFSIIYQTSWILALCSHWQTFSGP